MPKQKIILIIGVILAIMAVFMTKTYIDQQRQLAEDDARKKISNMQASIPKNEVQVLIANKDIPKGVTIDASSLETSVVPEKYRQPQAVSSVDRILGMVTINSIAKGEQITLSKLAQTRQLGGLAEGTPVGKRAITVSVDNIASLAGMIKPGNYVDIIALVPVPVQTPDGKQVSQAAVVPLFQNILVLAVGQDTAGETRSTPGGRYSSEEERKISVSPFITLAINPQEVNLLAFVQEQGKIRLILRSPADSKLEPTQPASWETLFRYIMPPQEGAVKPIIKELPKTTTEEYVEVYRGLNKERIPLSK
ncbi:MAG: Flp pilus assembly protein CpaB [Candidatus Omnitrophota bacterium]